MYDNVERFSTVHEDFASARNTFERVAEREQTDTRGIIIMFGNNDEKSRPVSEY